MESVFAIRMANVFTTPIAVAIITVAGGQVVSNMIIDLRGIDRWTIF